MKYTVPDLMIMRHAIRWMATDPVGTWEPGGAWDTPALDAHVERQLVTYMMNETAPRELWEAAGFEWPAKFSAPHLQRLRGRSDDPS